MFGVRRWALDVGRSALDVRRSVFDVRGLWNLPSGKLRDCRCVRPNRWWPGLVRARDSNTPPVLVPRDCADQDLPRSEIPAGVYIFTER